MPRSQTATMALSTTTPLTVQPVTYAAPSGSGRSTMVSCQLMAEPPLPLIPPLASRSLAEAEGSIDMAPAGALAASQARRAIPPGGTSCALPGVSTCYCSGAHGSVGTGANPKNETEGAISMKDFAGKFAVI